MKTLLLSAIALLNIFLISAEKEQSRIYDFPVRPGTEAWKSLRTERERFDAMQIPVEQLKDMTTDDLIITCMNYPAFGYIEAFNNKQDGLNHIINRFNGLKELLEREDISSKMLSLFLNGFSDKAFEGVNSKFWSIRSRFFKFLLAKDEIISRLGRDEKMLLLKTLEARISKLSEDSKNISMPVIESEFLILANLLDKSGDTDFKKKKEENPDIDNFIKTGRMDSPAVINDLLSVAFTTDPVYDTITIYTPNGTPVTALVLEFGEMNTTEKEDLKIYWLEIYDYRITFLTEATYYFNCHGYAWYSIEGGRKVWLNSPEEEKFWIDGSYFLSATPAWQAKVSFVYGDHSAIVHEQPGMFFSKWGEAPVFKHTIEDCPYDSSVLNYYVKTCNIDFTDRNVTSAAEINSCGTVNIRNVSVTNNAKLQVEAPGTVSIEGPFAIQGGSSFNVLH